MDVLKLEGGYFKNIERTFEYFFYWVLPYLWHILFIASLILALINAFIFRRIK